MKRLFSKRQPAGHAAFRKLITFCVMVISAFTVTACHAKDREMIKGLGVELYNYSQDAIVSVKINGEDVGVTTGEARIGSAKGGAVVCCSSEISAIKNTADVTVRTVKFVNGKNGAVEYDTYTTQALVELPFPDLMSTLIIHVLPGHKVVLEVTPGPSDARQDLMDAQIKALGLKKEVDETGFMRAERPRYTGYYKP